MKNNLLLKVLLAIVLAGLAGWMTGSEMAIFGVTYVRIYGLIGQLFLNALTLVVVPLVSASIITGTARMGSEQSFGRLGAKTFGWFIGTNLIAILVGLVSVLLIAPGVGIDYRTSITSATTLVQPQGDTFDQISLILLKIIPSNILAVASQGQMLGLIGFSLLFGFFISKIDAHPKSIILGFWQAIFQIMMRITHLVMGFLPIGVFGLVAKVVATTGLETLGPVALFFAAVLVALSIYALIILPLFLAFVAGVNPILHFRAVSAALLTAFSTSSTAATLPVTIECLEKKASVSNRICSFVIPLSSSLNLSGTALYQCAAVLFIAQAYGIVFSLPILVTVVLMCLLTSMGMAGIPSAGLISIVLILNTIGVPAEGIGLILAVERILDMCRTTVSVLGNTCCAVLIARSEGEVDVLSPMPSLRTE